MSAPKPPQKPKAPKPKAGDQEAKARKEIPLVSVPNDRDAIADDMAEMFDEDQVTHQHGRTEPERD
jgi:hypothetical protein